MKRRQLLAATGLAGAGWAIGAGRDRAAAGPRCKISWTTSAGAQEARLQAVDSTPMGTWAVGYTEDFTPFALRWIDDAWAPIPLPGQEFWTLYGVAVAAADDVWVVGIQDEVGPGEPTPVVLRWTGAAWHVVPAPAVATGGFSAVVVAPDGSVWVAGWAEIEGTAQGVVYRYVDGGWQLIADGLDETVNVNALLVLSPTDAWLAMNPGVAHFDGRSWTRAEEFADDGTQILTALAATGPDDVWVVGTLLDLDDDDDQRALAAHFDGSSWTRVPVPRDSAALNGIAIWNGQPIAVGERFDESDGEFAYVLQGRRDRFVRVKGPVEPSRPRAVLTGIVAGPSRLWTVGGARTDDDDTDIVLAAYTE